MNNKFINIIHKDIEIINEDIQKSNKIIKNKFDEVIHNIKVYSKQHPDEFRGIIGAIVIVIIIIVIFSVFMHYYCINGQQKTKTGECCSLGATDKRNVCYKTTCPIGERNKFGHCCPNGLTDEMYYGRNLNCDTFLDGSPNHTAYLGVSCLYGKTHFGDNCYLKPCQYSIYQEKSSPRTILNYTKCCLNGLAPNEEYCNDLHCNPNMVTDKGKCCKHGAAKGNNKICNHRKKRNGRREWFPKRCTEFGSSGTCCTNGLTNAHNGKYCNEKCKYDDLTISGVCCDKEGVTASAKKKCNEKCKHKNSTHTIKGACCPVSKSITYCSINNE